MQQNLKKIKFCNSDGKVIREEKIPSLMQLNGLKEYVHKKFIEERKENKKTESVYFYAPSPYGDPAQYVFDNLKKRWIWYARFYL